MPAASVEFGLTLPQRAALFGAMTAADLFELARQADSHPAFASVWVGDSLGAKPRPDALTLLGGLASATKRVKLGVGCMASFPVRDPIVFAYQWATLDMLSAGRMLLAVCTGIVQGGASMREGRPFGVIDKERASRMEENIEICRKLWSGQATSFEGRFHQFEEATVLPRPVQDPCPIWIAANPNSREPQNVARSFARAARIADGFMTTELWPGDLRPKMEQFRGALREAGRDAATFPNIIYHNININEDRDTAYEESKKFLDAYYGPVFNETMVRAWTAHGSPAECVEQIRALVDAGAKAVTLRITSWDQWGQYKRLVDEVIPRLS